jgi:hypothetical protein
MTFMRVGPRVALVVALGAVPSGCGNSDDNHKGGTGGSAGNMHPQGGSAGVTGGSAGKVSQAGVGGTSSAGHGASGGSGGSEAGHAGDAGFAGKGGGSGGSADAGRGGTTAGDTGQGGHQGGSPSGGSENGGFAAGGEAGASGAPPSCTDLQMQYADELTKAKVCDPNASKPQCQDQVPAPLGCNTCFYIVNDATTLFAIKAAYEDQACEAHFCQQVSCMPTELGLCSESGGSAACLDRQP